MKKLVSALYNTNAGKPCVVIGGGPSVPDDLGKIPGWQNMLQISANGHGFKVPGAFPTFIFTKDDAECPPRPRKRDAGPFKPMEPQMRVHGVPIISLQYWGDYRCPGGPPSLAWPFQGNSGQHALAVAALMGSCPVIGVGFDCFQGPTYFHGNERNVSGGKKIGYWQVRYKRYAERFRSPTNIRGVSGVLAETFGYYTPTTLVADMGVPDVLRVYEGLNTVKVRTLRAYQDPGRATQVPENYVLPASEAEAARLVGLGVARDEI